MDERSGRRNMCYFDGKIKELGKINKSLRRNVIKKLDEDPDIWERENAKKRNNYGAFGNTTKHIILQFPDNDIDHTVSTYSPIWDEWGHLVKPLIKQATRSYKYSTGKTSRIMFARLEAGASITPHVDENPSANVPHKIHIPLITDPGVTFYEESTGFHLKAGCAYEVNNKIMHSVTNNSIIDRVHLVFDYYPA